MEQTNVVQPEPAENNDTKADSSEKDEKTQPGPTNKTSDGNEDNSGSSSGYSDFEDELDAGHSIAADLERNYELMKKCDERQRSLARGEGCRTVVYDCNASIVRYTLLRYDSRR